jgi:hypothetical protein
VLNYRKVKWRSTAVRMQVMNGAGCTGQVVVRSMEYMV